MDFIHSTIFGTFVTTLSKTSRISFNIWVVWWNLSTIFSSSYNLTTVMDTIWRCVRVSPCILSVPYQIFIGAINVSSGNCRKQSRHCTYNVTLWRVPITILAIETKHCVPRILLMFMSSCQQCETHLGRRVKCPIFPYDFNQIWIFRIYS